MNTLKALTIAQASLEYLADYSDTQEAEEAFKEAAAQIKRLVTKEKRKNHGKG